MESQEDLLEKLAAIRGQVADKKACKDQLENAPLPAKILIAQKHAEIDEVLDHLCQGDIRRMYTTADLGPILVACFADQLKERVADRIQKTVGKSGVSLEEKTARLTQIENEVLKLEHEEETICIALEAAGLPVIRRGDLNPAVFFEVGPESGDLERQAS